jgi:hypothetical protein
MQNPTQIFILQPSSAIRTRVVHMCFLMVVKEISCSVRPYIPLLIAELAEFHEQLLFIIQKYYEKYKNRLLKRLSRNFDIETKPLLEVFVHVKILCLQK